MEPVSLYAVVKSSYDDPDEVDSTPYLDCTEAFNAADARNEREQDDPWIVYSVGTDGCLAPLVRVGRCGLVSEYVGDGYLNNAARLLGVYDLPEIVDGEGDAWLRVISSPVSLYTWTDEIGLNEPDPDFSSKSAAHIAVTYGLDERHQIRH